MVTKHERNLMCIIFLVAWLNLLNFRATTTLNECVVNAHDICMVVIKAREWLNGCYFLDDVAQCMWNFGVPTMCKIEHTQSVSSISIKSVLFINKISFFIRVSLRWCILIIVIVESNQTVNLVWSKGSDLFLLPPHLTDLFLLPPHLMVV